MAGPIKEWVCLEHGEFEGSHAICPAEGCDSSCVNREIRTPITIGSRMVRQFDAGIRKSADDYKIRNFRTARAGEAAYGGDAARELGTEVLWGSDIQKKLPGNLGMPQLLAQAHKPLVVPKRDGSGVLRLDKNNAMREAATEARITQRRLAQAEVTVPKGGKKDEAVARVLVT
jgi:hypothetical protein